MNISRRQWLASSGIVPFALTFGAPGARGATVRTALGVTWESYRLRARLVPEESGGKPLSDALSFLGYCQELGAGGIQIPLAWLETSKPGKVRRAAEAADMYVEVSVELPRDQGDLSRFQDSLRAARNAGASVVHASMLEGARHQTLQDEEAVKRFARQFWKSLTMAEPLLRKRRMRLAVENHRDLRLEELGNYVDKISSEFVGVCLDTANGLALLETPMETVQALAPYAYSVHLKDVLVEEYEQGFRMVEVPLGEGVLDLRRIIQLVQQARPDVHFSFDLAAPEPVDIPFLSERYWMSLPRLPGWRVAQTLAWVRANPPLKQLPDSSRLSLEERLRLEDQAVKRSLAYAPDLGL